MALREMKVGTTRKHCPNLQPTAMVEKDKKRSTSPTILGVMEESYPVSIPRATHFRVCQTVKLNEGAEKEGLLFLIKFHGI